MGCSNSLAVPVQGGYSRQPVYYQQPNNISKVDNANTNQNQNKDSVKVSKPEPEPVKETTTEKVIEDTDDFQEKDYDQYSTLV